MAYLAGAGVSQQPPQLRDPSGHVVAPPPVPHANTQDAPTHRHCEVESQVTAHEAAVPHLTVQLDEPLHATPHDAAPPQSTAHGALSLQVTPHDPLSSHATSHGPPMHVAAHDAASAHCAVQLVAEHTHALLAQRQIPPAEQETSGDAPQPANAGTRASTAMTK